MKIKCNFCNGKCIKNGFQSNGNQRYRCSVCQKRQQSDYKYIACKRNVNQSIVELTKEGLGIRSTARILRISTTTLLKRIITIARKIQQPTINKGKTYEVDEMCTYIRHKRNFIWLVYALEKDSKTVVSFNVGKRTNKILSRVLDTLKLSEAKRIFTDRLKKLQVSDQRESTFGKTFRHQSYRKKKSDPENAFKKIKPKNNLFQ